MNVAVLLPKADCSSERDVSLNFYANGDFVLTILPKFDQWPRTLCCARNLPSTNVYSHTLTSSIVNLSATSK